MKKLIGILLLSAAAQVHAVAAETKPTFTFADLLMWQVRESGADNWGQLAMGSGSSQVYYKVLEAPFEWNAGVRVGVGHSFHQGGYDISLAYTHYQTSARNQASGTVISAFDGNYFVNNTDGSQLDISYNAANVRYQFYFNALDLNLGHHYTIDSVLEVHPYIGLKAAAINQRIYSNWLNPTVPTNFTAGTEDLKNDFSGIGPAMGVDSSWSVYKCPEQSVNLVGNLVGALLYGHTSFSDIYQNNLPTTITIHNNSINGASPMLGGLLGLQWHRQLSQSDFSIRLGYEAQIWFNQLKFYSLNLGKVMRPVSLQGGDVEFRFNF